MLANSGVETSVNSVGRDDAVPAGLSVHAEGTEQYRRSWFLTFEPSDDARKETIAVLAREISDNRWRGAWTFDPSTTRRVADFYRAEPRARGRR